MLFFTSQPAIAVISFGATAASDEQRMSIFSTPQDRYDR